jgi:hypothetical protein
MNLINRGRPNEHHATIRMLNLQVHSKIHGGNFYFPSNFDEFCLSIWHSWYGFRDIKKFNGNLMK